MSWPDDGEPRFVVTVLHGYQIVPGSTSRGSGWPEPAPSAYVLDRAYCDRIVASFEVARGNQWKVARDCVALAHACAFELNEADG